MIVVVCLDSHSQQWGETDLYMPALGLDWNDVVEVTDELSGEVYHWGQRNAVGLDPHWRAGAHPAGTEPVDPPVTHSRSLTAGHQQPAPPAPALPASTPD